MSTAYDPYAQNAPQDPLKNAPPRKSSTGRNCLIGCLVLLLLMILICGGIALWGYFYGGRFFMSSARNAVDQAVRESGMPEEEREEVMAQVDRVNDAYQSGDIQFQDLMRVGQELAQSPVFVTFMVYAIEKKYVEPSGLSDEEKTAAHRTLQRVMRGIVEKKIDPEQLDLSPVMQGTGQNKKLKEKVTDEELRQALANMKAKADEAMIPDEEYEVDIGAEMKKAVDKALGEQAAEAPAVE